MSDLREEQLEAMLSEHLHGRLDGQLGGASRRFAQFIASPNGRSTVAKAHGRARWMFPMGILGGAIAAAVTMVVMRHESVAPVISDPAPEKYVVASPDSGQREIDFTPVVRDASWKTTDEGVIEMTDGSMARLVTRERTDRMKWVDPRDHSVVEYSVPRKETMLIGLQRY